VPENSASQYHQYRARRLPKTIKDTRSKLDGLLREARRRGMLELLAPVERRAFAREEAEHAEIDGRLTTLAEENAALRARLAGAEAENEQLHGAIALLSTSAHQLGLAAAKLSSGAKEQRRFREAVSKEGNSE